MSDYGGIWKPVRTTPITTYVERDSLMNYGRSLMGRKAA